jgi:hypothetical protein
MYRVAEYLRINARYAAALGGLRWSADGEAVEYGDGSTFAFAGEVVSFLEGFASQRPLIHFAYILHLLCLLRRERTPVGGAPSPLFHAFREAGQFHRNAGAFCGVLCAELPPVPDPPSAWAVWQRVILQAGITTAGYLAGGPAEEPPLAPATFEATVLHALWGLPSDEVAHWLKHGQGPPRDEDKLAEAVVRERPPTLGGLLAEVSQRERLAGAVPFVEQMVSALTLPPRRLDEHALPQGGYSDVCTRGNPEQVLPTQFALDDLEFLRRHAEHELLYFRREEPHAPTREDLLVLLDQGTRTWGAVRLALAAAAFALGRYAERRRLPFRVAATSAGGAPCDPLDMNRDALAALLEASDLSPHPGLALERALADEAPAGRDVVLLTHPRNLAEPGVAAAARRVRPGTRLFALAVDGHGDAQFSELRRGAPVPLTRFHVDLERRPAPKPEPRPVEWARPPWRGDVERVGFPFQFGIGGTPPGNFFQFAFDHAGDWLLTCTGDWMLYATRTDGSRTEVLPRGFVDGRVVQDFQAVLGVAGGFVVVARHPALVALHYDFRTRTCKAHQLQAAQAPPDIGRRSTACWYLRRLHTLVVQHRGDPAQFVNLSTGGRDACRALTGARLEFPSSASSPDVLLSLPLQPDGEPSDPQRIWNWPSLCFSPASGTVILRDVVPPWQPFTPVADGKPFLRGDDILNASCQGHTLALLTLRPPAATRALRLFRGPEGSPLDQFVQPPGLERFALSADGRLLARLVRTSQVEIRDVAAGGPPLCVTLRGRFHDAVAVELGDSWLSIQVGETAHLVRWDEGRLVFSQARGSAAALIRSELVRAGLPTDGARAVSRPLPDFLREATGRFRAAAWRDLIAVVDAHGQVALFTHAGELLCMFFAFRNQVAAWAPDGTCYGPQVLLGQRSTPGALERIGQALRAAWRGHRVPR